MRKSNVSVVATMLIVMLSVLSLASCEPRVLESEVAFAEPIVDNLLSAIEEEDYGKFSTDLGRDMKEAIVKKGFPSIVSTMADSLGAYKSREFKKAARAKAKGMTLVIITYRAHYEKNDDAVMTVYINTSSDIKSIEGFSVVPAGGTR